MKINTLLKLRENYPKLWSVIDDIKPIVQIFLQEKDLNFAIDDIPTASFNPFTKKMTIGQFYEDLLNGKNVNKRYKDKWPELIRLDLLHSIFHEASHYRDLKIEQDRHGKSSMKQILLQIHEKNIKIGENIHISFSKPIHDLYNSLDDIVVNKELENFHPFEIDANDQMAIYKEILFPSIDKQGNIIISDDVDYSWSPLYSQFANFFLRKAMVPQWNIILEKNLNHIIRSPNIDTAYQRLYTFINQKEKIFIQDPQKNERYQKVKDYLIEKKIFTKHFTTLTYLDLFQQISKHFQGHPLTPKSPFNTNFFNLIEYFTKTKWKDEWHHLIIPPYLRYEIISKLIEPLYEILIVLHWIDVWKITYKKKLPTSDLEDDDILQAGSGQCGIKHDDMNIEDKIKLLDQLEESDVIKELEKTKNTTKKTLNNVFDNTSIKPTTLKLLQKMQKDNAKDIATLSSFFEWQLTSVKRDIMEKYEKAKKGTLSYHTLRKEINKNPVTPDTSFIYNRMDVKEIIKEEFKKMDRTFILDISGSMDQHKWANGALSYVTHVFSQTLMHLEKALQNLLNDPDYKINMNFILYGDDIWFSTLGNKEWEDTASKFKFAKSFEETQLLSGGTDDTVWWQKVASEIKQFISQHPDYKQEIEDNQRRPIIIQIADTDISENGINILTDTIKEIWLNPSAFSIKRLILGHYADVKTSDQRKEIYTTDKDHKRIKIKKQEFVWKKSEIIYKIMDLFKNFIQEYEG